MADGHRILPRQAKTRKNAGFQPLPLGEYRARVRSICAESPCRLLGCRTIIEERRPRARASMLRPTLVLWACSVRRRRCATPFRWRRPSTCSTASCCSTTNSSKRRMPPSDIAGGALGSGTSLNAGDALYALALRAFAEVVIRSAGCGRRARRARGAGSDRRPTGDIARRAPRAAAGFVRCGAAAPDAGARSRRVARGVRAVGRARAGRPTVGGRTEPSRGVRRCSRCGAGAFASERGRTSEASKKLLGYVARRPPERATPSRKAEHIRINIERDVAAKGIDTGLRRLSLSIIRRSPNSISPTSTVVQTFRATLAAPLLISCMTGGTPEARRINQRWRASRSEFGLAMGLGSGRALFESPESLDSFAVRHRARRRAVCEPRRRAAQQGYAPTIAGVWSSRARRRAGVASERAARSAPTRRRHALSRACSPNCGSLRRAEFPVIVKEVGWGIAPDSSARCSMPAFAVDLPAPAARRGAKSSAIASTTVARARRRSLRGWGIPTADAACRGRGSRRPKRSSRAAASATVSTSPKRSRSAPISSAWPARFCAPPTRAAKKQRISHANSSKRCA